MIVFVDYLYKGVGGVGQLIVNTTLEMNKRGEQTKLYCSSESYEYMRLKESNASFVFIDSDSVSLQKLAAYISPEDVVFLTHINNTPLLEKIKKLNNKIIFYSIHPYTFFCYWWRMDKWMNQNYEALRLIKLLLNNNALYFMDGPNLQAIYNRDFEMIKEPPFLPIPVISYQNFQRDYAPEGNRCLTYLGRGNEEWKIFPVIKILEDLNTLDRSFRFSIITDTNDMFEKMISKYIPNNKVIIEYHNDLSGERLEEYLMNCSYLHFAMGTSALEASKLGVPTVLVDFSTQKFPDNYLYRWIFETIDYSLAGEIIGGKVPYNYGATLEEILFQIYTAEGYRIVSNKCYEYTEKNHSIKSFVDLVQKACNKTSMTTRLYCSTGFSKNMRRIKPIYTLAGKILKIMNK